MTTLRSSSAAPFEEAIPGTSHRLLTHEDEVELGQQFRAARRDLCDLVVCSAVGARELSRLAERLQSGELALALLMDVDTAAAEHPASDGAGQTRHAAAERQFLSNVGKVARLHEQPWPDGEPEDEPRQKRRLCRLGAQLHLRDDVLCDLAQRVKTSHPRTHATHRAIADAQLRSNRARDEFVRCNVRFVVTLAKRYVGKGLSLSDLVQEGSLGLIRAVEKFDPSRGYRFSTYAAWWVRQSMGRALCNQSRTIRIPVHAIELNRQLTHARRAWEQRTGRPATPAELAEAMGLDPSKVEAFAHLVKEPLSLDAPVGTDAETNYGDFVADAAAGPAQRAIEADLAQHIQALLGRLTERERMIVRLRFGLDGRGTRTLQEIGEATGVSRERIRQLEVEALRKLRRIAPALLPEAKD